MTSRQGITDWLSSTAYNCLCLLENGVSRMKSSFDRRSIIVEFGTVEIRNIFKGILGIFSKFFKGFFNGFFNRFFQANFRTFFKEVLSRFRNRFFNILYNQRGHDSVCQRGHDSVAKRVPW